MTVPMLEVTAAAANGAARMLTTTAKVQAVLGIATDTALIEAMIERVSALAAARCGLARDVAGAMPTFGLETLRATWFVDSGERSRGSALILPWRVPVTAITSVVEAAVTLTAGTDYRLVGGGLVERLAQDTLIAWSNGKIVVAYVAGWALATANAVPPDLEAAVIEQVKGMYVARARDPAVRSVNVPEVYSASYSVAGGDSVGSSGLLPQVEAALAPYKNWNAG